MHKATPKNLYTTDDAIIKQSMQCNALINWVYSSHFDISEEMAWDVKKNLALAIIKKIQLNHHSDQRKLANLRQAISNINNDGTTNVNFVK